MRRERDESHEDRPRSWLDRPSHLWSTVVGGFSVLLLTSLVAALDLVGRWPLAIAVLIALIVLALPLLLLLRRRVGEFRSAGWAVSRPGVATCETAASDRARIVLSLDLVEPDQIGPIRGAALLIDIEAALIVAEELVRSGDPSLRERES
jgi:hypothetical protein